MAKGDSAVVQQKESQRERKTKDDISRLLHIVKEPAAQCHWSNLYGTGCQEHCRWPSEAARPLSYLA